MCVKQERDVRVYDCDGSLDSDAAGERIPCLGNRIAICTESMCNHESNEDV